MKILLDECVDRRLANELTEILVKTVPQMGWANIKNGKLLALAEKEFDVFLTVDRNISFQQNIINFEITIIVLCAKSNRVSDLKPLIEKVLKILPSIEKRRVYEIGI